MAQRERSAESLEVLSHQLSMIADLVRLTHEQLASPRDPGAATGTIIGISDALSAGRERTEELAVLLRVDHTVDRDVLILGRGSSSPDDSVARAAPDVRAASVPAPAAGMPCA